MGKLYVGVLFYRDDESGIAKVSVYNDTKAEFVIEDQYVDLYSMGQDADSGEYEQFTYWCKLPYPDDNYTVTVEHSGYRNASAGSPYNISYNGFFYTESIDESELQSKIYSWDEDFPGDIYEDALTVDTMVDLSRIKSFVADGALDTFLLDDSDYHAANPGGFLQWSEDGGTNWFYPNDIAITWGSNDPDYDNETFDADGHFGIKFLTVPVIGTAIQIKWLPSRDKAYLQRELKYPSSESIYIDVRGELRLLDDALEFIE